MQPGYLQSQDRFDECMIAGSSEGDFQAVSKSLDAAALEARPLIGLYGAAGPHRAFLYRWAGQLKIRIDDTAPIAIGAGLSSSWELDGNQARFSLLIDGKAVSTFRYEASRELLGIQRDPTPFVEPDHFDFFLLMHRVLQDAPRHERLFR